ncbi:MAG: pimeloyl-ACP methyl ester carboxylesterase [Parasphingorhabdus sp.]|jgi:pimeloyl-ACP methyl ester carboxylesterase
MYSNILWFSAITLLLYLIFGLFLYLRQSHFLYFPTESVHVDEIHFEYFRSKDVEIKVWVANPQGDQAIIYFGGNAEQVAETALEYKQLFPNKAVYLLNYRGYAGSSGFPTELGLKEDALTLFDRVAKKHQNIDLIGRSIGSSMALHVAARRTIRNCILVTPFDSILKLAQQRFSFYPIKWLLRDKYESWIDAKNIDCSVLVIVAEEDRIVPRQSSDRLIANLPANNLVVEILPNAGHNRIEENGQYFNLLKEHLTGFKEN